MIGSIALVIANHSPPDANRSPLDADPGTAITVHCTACLGVATIAIPSVHQS